MNIAYPSYWFWWLAIPVSLGIMYLVYRRVRLITYSWFDPGEYRRSFPLLKFFLRMGGYVLLFVALLGPYWGTGTEPMKVMGREVYILLDVSASMNARDLFPSRLEKAKQELHKLIDALKGDKIGLVVFTDNAYVQCPLTTDHQAVSLFLDLVSTDQFAQTGTNFRSALGVVLARFMKEEEPREYLSRAVVLVSDGEDFGGTYTSIIDRMQQLHVNIFTVGIGSLTGAPVPELQEGRLVGYKTYQDGRRATTYLEETKLMEIASASGTPYHRIDEQDKGMEELIQQLKAIAASPLATRMEQVNHNKYQLFLGLALLLFLVSLFIMPIRTNET